MDSAKIVVIDTATPTMVVGALRIDDEACACVADASIVSARHHNELLMPAIMKAATDAGWQLAQLDALAVGIGPGPFTGLRVGMATALALGDALSIPVYPVCTLDALSIAAEEEHPRSGKQKARLSFIATDARRKEIYWALFDHGKRCAGPCVDTPESAAMKIESMVSDLPERVIMPESVPCLTPWVDSRRQKSVLTPLSLAEVLRRDKALHRAPGSVRPLYLRRPDATIPSEKPMLSVPDYYVRLMDVSDCSAVAAQEHDIFSGEAPWSEAAFLQELSRPESYYLVAESAGHIVGYAGCAFTGPSHAREAEIHTLAVCAQWRGHHIGSTLLDHLLLRIDAHHAATFLEVRTTNEPALALYRSRGFTRIAVRENYYQPSGEDAYVMRREAPAAAEKAPHTRSESMPEGAA